MNKHFYIIFLALFCVSSCSSLDPNSNFVCLYDSDFGRSCSETFGIEYPKYEIDKNDIFNLNVMAANFNYSYAGSELYDYPRYEYIYIYIENFERNTLYKLDIDPIKFASKDYYISPKKVKYDNFKHKFFINLKDIFNFDYSNFVYVGMKFLNGSFGYSLDVSYRFNFVNIKNQTMTLDNLIANKYENTTK